MDVSSINILFKDVIISLMNPLIDILEVEQTIHFLETDLKPLYMAEIDIIQGIEYVKNILKELIVFDKRYKNLENDTHKADNLYDIVLIIDNHLCVKEDNKKYLNSRFTIIEYLIKTIIHLIWQRLYEIYENKPLNIGCLEKASKLYESVIVEFIGSMKKGNIVKI
jgi:hypothetical protein